MYDYKSKKANIAQMNGYMLAKTLSMFEYDALPESIPQIEFERMLQTSGYAFVTEVEGTLYAFTGGLGGIPDVYGQPTQITISNPALNFNKTLSLKDDGVLFINDSLRIGLLPLFEKHNTLLAENEVSMVMHGYNTRIQKVISASDDRTRASAEVFVKKAVDGELAVIGENALFDGVKFQGGTGDGAGSIMSLIEYQQYIKSSMYNEIGLGQNFNMKRERLVSAEIEQIRDSIYPYVYDMLKCRLKALEKLNAKYELAIAVDFGSVWNANVKSYVDDVIPAGQPLVDKQVDDAGVGEAGKVDELPLDEVKPVVEGESVEGIEAVTDVPSDTQDKIESVIAAAAEEIILITEVDETKTEDKKDGE